MESNKQDRKNGVGSNEEVQDRNNHFDSSQGGRQVLPKKINIEKYVSARAREIMIMTQCIENPQNSKLVFQKLPVHMRRRVMSHNTKRLPRRLRQAHQNQLDKSRSSNSTKTKPSRRYRRRPARLAEHFAKRKLNKRWLETHLWHAKRFHMVQKWGFSLPERSCDKSFRACYRASSAHCLLRDISYLRVISVSGPIDSLTIGFRKVTSSSCGLTITAKAFVDSPREGNAYLFRANEFPRGCLGKVSFLWELKKDNNLIRKLWIFVHPAESESVLEALNAAFADINNVNVLKIEESFNRFRLTGPLSHPVLVAALEPLSSDIPEGNSKGIEENWFKQYLQKIGKNIHESQSLYWNELKNVQLASELPPHLVLGLNVKDPRINMPFKRTKVISGNLVDNYFLTTLPKEINESPIWDSNILKIATENLLNTCQINKLKENSLIPGAELAYEIPGVPIILIQRPGSREYDSRQGFDSGWDIIVPSGFAMAFWMAFILRGARVGGLRETETIDFEIGRPHYEPDILSGQMEEKLMGEVLRTKYYKTPPCKRVNFNKLRISSPFNYEWSTLIKNWNQQTDCDEKFYVLRDKLILNKLKLFIKSPKDTNHTDIDWSMNCLVAVKVSSSRKGRISNRCLICLPKLNDITSTTSSQLVEPMVKDKLENERKKLRKSHKQELKRLRRKRIKLKREQKVTIEKNAITDYKKMMERLWVPESDGNVRNQCSKDVMGFVTKGDFCFTEAKPVGIGYVTLQSLKEIIKDTNNPKNLVLTRNITSRQYRLAKLCIV